MALESVTAAEGELFVQVSAAPTEIGAANVIGASGMSPPPGSVTVRPPAPIVSVLASTRLMAGLVFGTEIEMLLTEVAAPSEESWKLEPVTPSRTASSAACGIAPLPWTPGAP